MEKIKILMFIFYAFILVILAVTATLSTLEIWPFEVYQRKYAPPGISTGQNKSPYTPK